MNANKFTSWEDAVRWLIDQPEKQDLVRNCYFDQPTLSAAQRYYQSKEWIAVRKLMPNTVGSVLDVGAGMGISSYALARDGWQVTALEPDSSNLVGANAIRNLAQDAGLDIAVEEEMGEALPFKDNSFDIIHARQVLHHAYNLGEFCTELYRVLKPGGRLIATREHVISNATQLTKFLAKHPLHEIYGGENAFRRNEYEAFLRSAGFNITNVFGPWDSIINYAPYTRHKIHQLIVDRFGSWPGVGLFARLALSKIGFLLGRRILAVFDRRPGRLYTFVAEKQESTL